MTTPPAGNSTGPASWQNYGSGESRQVEQRHSTYRGPRPSREPAVERWRSDTCGEANMTKSIAIAVVLAVCLACAAQAAQEKPSDKPKLKVEFRWAEEKPTEGLTDNKGFDLSCTDKKAY